MHIIYYKKVTFWLINKMPIERFLLMISKQDNLDLDRKYLAFI